MDSTPLFSIITVTFNAGSCILPTMESLQAQAFTDFEHIIADGASTDSTLEIVGSHPTPGQSVVSEPDSGLYDAMNKGLARARGKYVLFLNAGDALHSPDTLAHLARVIEDYGYPGIVYGQTDIVDSSRRRIASRHLSAPESLGLADFARGMLVCHQAFAVLRRITPQFDLRYRFSADYDWCIRCLQHSRLNVYAGCTVADYLQEGISTANRRRSLAERFRIMCHYYGTLPTVWRHLGFLPRFIKRHRLEKRIQKHSHR